MNQSTMTPASDRIGRFPAPGLATTVPDRGTFNLADALREIEDRIPPLWPLRDYVAVNPFLGHTSERFLAARQSLRQVRDCELLPSSEYFREQFLRGKISLSDIQAAFEQCRDEHPDLYSAIDVDLVLLQISARPKNENEMPTSDREREYFTISEVFDQRHRTSWTSHIINDITRHCSAHFDEGQAAWPNPWRGLPLYQAWQQSAGLSHRMDMLGITGFQSLVAELPSAPRAAISWLLQELGVPQQQRQSFLLTEIYSIAGWASYVKYQTTKSKASSSRNDDLLGLIAIRLAYDVALDRLSDSAISRQMFAENKATVNDRTIGPPTEVLARYVLQVAAETAYRRSLCGMLNSACASDESSNRRTLQMIFCIDVRSEVMRRHLEATSEQIETSGFAGFFAMPFEYVQLGEPDGSAQCPVLLQPAFQVEEKVADSDPQVTALAKRSRRFRRSLRKAWKSFQASAVSCFSYVESLGLAYTAKLLTDSCRLTRPVGSAENDGIAGDRRSNLGPDIDLLPANKRVDLAEGMLRNLGLTTDFARIVAVCGHEAAVTNNPYKASLDCGACGGHSGKPNARLAAAMLNDSETRAELASRGIDIPEDTWFVAAVHNTTTDTIQFFDDENMPQSHSDEFADVRRWTEQASGLCRDERSLRMGESSGEKIPRRSGDWSETRPEWGLAGNAAFIVAPRARTRGLNLGGRVFLHNYDPLLDPDLKILELIMTAPMVVTNWINLQYYASAVDNRSFGSGDKVIHNVVGQFGVLSGNGGDLTTGLPWQSVHDGNNLQHEPLRLLVIIQSSRESVERIIEKHSQVFDLVTNGWLTLVVREGDSFHRWNSHGEWEAEPTMIRQPQTT